MLLLTALFCLLLLLIAFTKQQIVQSVALISHSMIGHHSPGMWLYAVCFFPGTFLHELAHFLTAKILHVKTGTVNLWPKKAGASVTLGSVMVAKADFFRMAVIGIAPFVLGLAVVSLIVYFNLSWLMAPAVDQSFIQNTVQHGKQPITWLIFYAVIVLSHAMYPSEADRKELQSIAIVIVSVIGILACSHLLPTIPLSISQTIEQLLRALDTILVIVLVFNILVWLCMSIIQKALHIVVY